METYVDSDSGSATSTALVQRVPADVGDNLQFQKLWLAIQRRKWRSLAVLSTDRGIDTLRVAELLAKLAWWYRGQTSSVFDLRDLTMRLVEYHQQEVQIQADTGSFVVMALRSSLENPTAIPMARSADAVALCIDLGKTALSVAEQTLKDVGADRVLGAIVVRSSGRRGP